MELLGVVAAVAEPGHEEAEGARGASTVDPREHPHGNQRAERQLLGALEAEHVMARDLATDHGRSGDAGGRIRDVDFVSLQVEVIRLRARLGGHWGLLVESWDSAKSGVISASSSARPSP